MFETKEKRHPNGTLEATEFQLDMVSLEGMNVLASRMRP
jgi:hypothetical protein